VELTFHLLLGGEGEQSPMHPQPPFVANESPLPKSVHEEAHSRARRTDHLRESLLGSPSAPPTSSRIAFQNGLAAKESERVAFRWNARSDPRSFPRLGQSEREEPSDVGRGAG